MSFYGSIYYQATNAIAKILIKNSGLNSTIGIDDDNLQDTEIDADGRAGVLILDSGNRWIQLKGDDETNQCKIYHNKADNNAKNFMRLINNQGEGTVLDISKGVTFTTPLLYYDDTGHVINNGLYETFTIPKIEIQSSIDELTDRVEELEKDFSTSGDTLIQVQADIQNIQSSMSGVTESVNTLGQSVGELDKDVKEVQEEQTTLHTALARDGADIKRLGDEITALTERVKTIEDWIAAQ